MGECISLAAFKGCVLSTMGLTCMCQDRCSHRICQYVRRGLVAPLQARVNAHHPPSDCLLCHILVCSQTADNQPFNEPRFYSNHHLHWQTDSPPSPPTHSVDLIARDHQHSHQTISSQGPRVSDLHRLYKDTVWGCVQDTVLLYVTSTGRMKM